MIWPLHDERENSIASKFFLLWKDIVADRQIKLAKAQLFSDLNLKVGVFQRWKEVVRKQKTQRELQEQQKQIQEDTIKQYLAQKYRERNLCSKIFTSWLMLAKIQQQKKKMIFLQQEKASSRLKVDSFLESLGDFKKKNNDWIMQKVQKDKNNIVINLDIAKKIYGPPHKKGELIAEVLPKLVTKPVSTKTKPNANKAPDETGDLQKEIIAAQRKKMREQWKLIEDLKEQKLRLENNRPTTKPGIVKKIEKRESLIDPALPEVEKKVLSPSTEVEVEDVPVSEVAYSDDFEDSVSEAASIVPKTPELVKKVREREEQRKAKMAEIKLFHEKKVAEERAKKEAKKEAEQKAEENDRKRRREMWRLARKEEAEKDKRRIAEKERQIRLAAVARDFHAQLTVKQYGLRPWLKLVISRRVEAAMAENIYTTRIKRQGRMCGGGT